MLPYLDVGSGISLTLATASFALSARPLQCLRRSILGEEVNCLLPKVADGVVTERCEAGSRNISELPPTLLACVYAITIPHWSFDSELCMHQPPPAEAQSMLWRMAWTWIKREIRAYVCLRVLNMMLN
jgi:hypothetical protein